MALCWILYTLSDTVVTLLQIAVGLLVTFLLGLTVDPLLKYVKNKSPTLPPPAGHMEEKWKELTKDPKEDKGGQVLGCLERFAFFAAFWVDAPAAIAAWLTFKVASKWDVWSNIISIPKDLAGVNALSYLIARRRWGSQRLMTFLIGTLYNILIGLLGVLVGRDGFAPAVALLC